MNYLDYLIKPRPYELEVVVVLYGLAVLAAWAGLRTGDPTPMEET